MNRSGAVNWKALVVILLFCGAIAFGIRQFNSGWREKPPAAFAFKRRSSPVLSADMRGQLRALVKEAQRLAGDQTQSLASLELLQLARDDKPDLLWRSDHLKNGGFEPLGNFERYLRGEEADLVGYYTLDGEPIAFTVKHDPKNAGRGSVTIHLEQPLAKSVSQIVLRVERKEKNVRQDDAGRLVARMGDGDSNQPGLRCRAVQLPAGAGVISATPEDVTTFPGESGPLIGWFAANGEEKPALEVTYQL